MGMETQSVPLSGWLAALGDGRARGLSGRVVTCKRQFWQIQWDSPPEGCGHLSRIRFEEKRETGLREEHFVGLSLLREHPLLRDYEEARGDLFVNGIHPNPQKILADMTRIVYEASKGWRTLGDYLNSHVRPDRVLQQGQGLLASGPRSLLESLSTLLKGHGVPCRIQSENPLPGLTPQVLTLGRNHILAVDFFLECGELS